MIGRLEQQAMARLRGAGPIEARTESRSTRRGTRTAVRRRMGGRGLSPSTTRMLDAVSVVRRPDREAIAGSAT